MSNNSVETATSTVDRLKIGFSVLVIIAGIIVFSIFSAQPMVARVSIFLSSLILAAAITWTSEPGKRIISFAGESYNEVKRVTWPTRKETVQMTGTVFAFVTVIGLFLWLVDRGLEWIIYSVALGWK